MVRVESDLDVRSKRRRMSFIGEQIGSSASSRGRI